MSRCVSDCREFVDVRGALLATRDAALIAGDFDGLGPPDLCCLEKLPKDGGSLASFFGTSQQDADLLPPNEGVLFCHYVLGLETSQPAAMAAYMYGLVARQEAATSWFGRKWQILGGVYCTFDVFHQVDIRVEVHLPPSAGWKSRFLSSSLAATASPGASGALHCYVFPSASSVFCRPSLRAPQPRPPTLCAEAAGSPSSRPSAFSFSSSPPPAPPRSRAPAAVVCRREHARDVRDLPPALWDAALLSALLRLEVPPVVHPSRCLVVFPLFEKAGKSREFVELATRFFASGDDLGLLPSIGQGTNALCEVLARHVLRTASVQKAVETLLSLQALSPLIHLHISRAYTRCRMFSLALSLLLRSIRSFPEEACFLRHQASVLLAKAREDARGDDAAGLESARGETDEGDTSAPWSLEPNSEGLPRETGAGRRARHALETGGPGATRRRGASAHLVQPSRMRGPSLSLFSVSPSGLPRLPAQRARGSPWGRLAVRAAEFAVSLSPTLFPFWLTLAEALRFCRAFAQALLALNAAPYVPLARPLYTKGLPPDIHRCEVTQPAHQRSGCFSFLLLPPVDDDFLPLAVCSASPSPAPAPSSPLPSSLPPSSPSAAAGLRKATSLHGLQERGEETGPRRDRATEREQYPREVYVSALAFLWEAERGETPPPHSDADARERLCPDSQAASSAQPTPSRSPKSLCPGEARTQSALSLARASPAASLHSSPSPAASPSSAGGHGNPEKSSGSGWDAASQAGSTGGVEPGRRAEACKDRVRPPSPPSASVSAASRFLNASGVVASEELGRALAARQGAAVSHPAASPLSAGEARRLPQASSLSPGSAGASEFASSLDHLSVCLKSSLGARLDYFERKAFQVLVKVQRDISLDLLVALASRLFLVARPLPDRLRWAAVRAPPPAGLRDAEPDRDDSDEPEGQSGDTRDAPERRRACGEPSGRRASQEPAACRAPEETAEGADRPAPRVDSSAEGNSNAGNGDSEGEKARRRHSACGNASLASSRGSRPSEQSAQRTASGSPSPAFLPSSPSLLHSAGGDGAAAADGTSSDGERAGPQCLPSCSLGSSLASSPGVSSFASCASSSAALGDGGAGERQHAARGASADNATPNLPLARSPREEEAARNKRAESDGRRERRERQRREEELNALRAWLDTQAPIRPEFLRRPQSKMLEKITRALESDLALLAQAQGSEEEEIRFFTSLSAWDPGTRSLVEKAGSFLVARGSLCYRLREWRSMCVSYGLALRLGLSCKASHMLLRYFARRGLPGEALRICSVTCLHVRHVCGEDLPALPFWMSAELAKLIDRVGVELVAASASQVPWHARHPAVESFIESRRRARAAEEALFN
ncbi:ChAPs (Chs5p-Arf1p-binding proteins) protein [Besnoitia besnoiti]|uniref:ChAPs (Chs5p-Arf1p-binding proteins) protein n=1 Tax=Besnoitia besnoiti TaxID=94643 RepID=A0A2A9MQE2_BESBE|nr:ChAPs (Chs5p-Arf1p-binding proteins) protein [Besnoitia besnoiti]PFH38746.1 ChAPs (Chs5p-Arf1p-binding proteins) protein [Besnoitia besnoiti]